MPNPFNTRSFNSTPQMNMNSIKQVYNLLRNSNNPNQLINQMMAQNPQMSQMLNLIKANGNNYEQVFRNMCNQRGINADEFIKNLTDNNT